MYLRTVLQSRSSRRAIAETDNPCRCRSVLPRVILLPDAIGDVTQAFLPVSSDPASRRKAPRSLTQKNFSAELQLLSSQIGVWFTRLFAAAGAHRRRAQA